MKRTSLGKRKARKAATAILALAAFAWPAAPDPVHAGVTDRVKEFFQLPGEVDRLKENYDQMQSRYDETMHQLDDAKAQAEAYRQAQDRLAEENARLAEQNRKLESMVVELKQSEEARAKKSLRLRQMGWTALFLAVGYVAVTRLARFLLRARVH